MIHTTKKPPLVERLNATFDHFRIGRNERPVLTKTMMRMEEHFGPNPDHMPMPVDDNGAKLFEMFDYFDTFGAAAVGE